MRLFSLFRRKPAERFDALPVPSLPAEALTLVVDEFGFPRPDWAHFAAWLAQYPTAEHATHYAAANHLWLEAMRASLPGAHTITASARFLILHPTELPERIGAYTALLEKLTSRLLLLLPGLASAPVGRMPVLLFGHHDAYHHYCAHYYPDYGEYGLSGGMFLATGTGHIALPYHHYAAAEPVLAHELTHAMLRTRRLPRWLDEGLAVTFEQTCYPPRRRETPFEQQAAHQRLWTEDNIQRFWRGDAFFAADEFQTRSYELAQTLVAGLSHDREAFLKFAQAADHRDAGEAAAQATFGFGLGQAMAAYLGQAKWDVRRQSAPSLTHEAGP
ncbi:MAG: hypothetical protein JO142_21595 [Burkholderiales bacterium]|nr:hypothetical protein [Burkholderiales bacterium]